MAETSSLLRLSGPAALHSLARAFAHFNEFDRFVAGLQSALDQSEHFDRLTIRIDRSLSDPPGHFSPGNLTLPLADGSGQFGTLQVAPAAGHRQFGPQDLHLMAGLADFLSATLTHAIRLQDAERRRELLRFLLDQAPLGIAAYDADHHPIVANDLAGRWLGDAGTPFADLPRTPGGFHLRASGKLIYGEVRRMAEDATGSWIVVLQDLAADQGRLLDEIRGETYRALAEGRRLGFALIGGAELADGVLRRLPRVRAALGTGGNAGPYDAHRLGVVLPGIDGLALRARLRQLHAAVAETPGLQLGYAELGRDGRTPGALLDAALQRHGTYEEMIRPALLVHDDNPAVADAFGMVLGREFRIVKSTSVEGTRRLLASESFEGLLTEIELRSGLSGLDLARFARERQPGIRAFFTTVQHVSQGVPAEAYEAGGVVLEKPFDVAALAGTVRSKLAE